MPDKPLLLIVDDERDMRELVGMNLRRAGFSTLEAADGVAALRMARENRPAAMLLDVMMPGRDGLHVLQDLRADESLKDIPVIMLTAKGMTEDRIIGFEKGADDYIPKPFSPKELVLRVQAVLRRSEAPAGGSDLTVGPFHFDLAAVKLSVNGAVQALTLLEFKLLHLLASHKGDTVERDVILREVWGYTDNVRTRTLDTHVKRLREKLGDLAEWVQTVRSFGYAFRKPADPKSPVA
jgi:two-component system phosphate regulon response regulator PhoB